jgi:hypothetical protein
VFSRIVRVPHPRGLTIAADGGMAGLLVRLEGIDPALAKPWDLPAPSVLATPDELKIENGLTSRIGVVRRGSEIVFAATPGDFLGVRGRGADFFSTLLPPNTASRRRLERPGRIDLTSPAYLYWCAADLWVADHPYFTVTANDGTFVFTNVPSGTYRASAYAPNWHIRGYDRDPETGGIHRFHYAPGVEKSAPITVLKQLESQAEMQFQSADFAP